jgi:lysozyme
VVASAPSDLPPCLDVEWDFLRRDGKYVLDKKGAKIDRWASLSRAEVIARMLTWLRQVEAATGRKPIVYTNANWWNARVGPSPELAGYKLWIADYSSRSLGREAPLTPAQMKWMFWQLTDRGVIPAANLSKGLDTSLLSTAEAEGLFGKP